MTHTIIVDDEQPAIDKMKHLLSDYPDYQVDAAFTSVRELLSSLDSLDIQVAFLDIAMPGIGGMELAGRLRAHYKENIKIVFVTAYDEYAVSAFELNAADYLLKPIKKERFQLTIDRLNRELSTVSLLSEKETAGFDTSPMVVRSFGKLEITGGANHIADWRTAKVRELFALFLHNYPEGIYRSNLLTMLWEELPADKALANLNTCNYYLRKFLEQSGAPIRLIHEKKYYRLDLGGVLSDVQLFEEAEANACHITPDNIDSILSGASVYRGKYFEDVNCTWANLKRDQFDIRYANLRVQTADFYKKNNDLENSIEQSILAIDKDPLCDQAWQILLDSYKAMNDSVRYNKTLENRKIAYKEKH